MDSNYISKNNKYNYADSVDVAINTFFSNKIVFSDNIGSLLIIYLINFVPHERISVLIIQCVWVDTTMRIIEISRLTKIAIEFSLDPPVRFKSLMAQIARMNHTYWFVPLVSPYFASFKSWFLQVSLLNWSNLQRLDWSC